MNFFEVLQCLKACSGEENEDSIEEAKAKAKEGNADKSP